MSEQFQEIIIRGFQMTFGKDGSINHSVTSPYAHTWFPIVVNREGTPLKYYRKSIGLGSNFDIPEGTYIAILPADAQGFWGKECPSCNKYFRVTYKEKKTTNIKKHIENEFNHCPYCGHKDLERSFFTENQKEFIKTYNKYSIQAITENTDIDVDLDKIVAGLKYNFTKFKYSEECQQVKIVCSNEECCCVYDVLGNEYTYCPTCGRNNFLESFNSRLDKIIQSDKTSEELLKNIVSEFDFLGNRLKQDFCNKSNSKKRRKDIRNINFQFITNAREELLRIFQIDIFLNVSNVDICLLNKLFQQRHILTHNAGIVDEKYIKRSNDTSVRLGQHLKPKLEEIKLLKDFLRQIAFTMHSFLY